MSRGQEGQRVLFTRYHGYLQESVTPVSLKRRKHMVRARASHSGSAGLLGWEEGSFSRYQSLRVGWEGDGGEGFCGLGWKEAASPGRPLKATSPASSMLCRATSGRKFARKKQRASKPCAVPAAEPPPVCRMHLRGSA